MIRTRSVILKKRSLYYDILCLQCKDKTFKDFCSDCVLKYNNEKSKKRYRSKKQKLSNKVDLDHQTSNNHLNSIKQIIPDCSVIKENSPLIINNESDVISVNKKVSIYAHLLCNDCQTKSTRSFCPPCKKKYACAWTSKKYYAHKLNKNSKELEIPHNLTDQTRHDPFGFSGPNYSNIDSFNRNDNFISGHVAPIIEQVPLNNAPSIQPSKDRCEKTYINRWSSSCNYSPNSKCKMIKVNYNHMPAINQKDLQEFFIGKNNESNTLDVCQKVADKYKDNNKTKTTNDYYKVASAMSPVLENTKKSHVRKILGCSNEKAGQIREGKAERKPKELKIKPEIKKAIHDFYDRSDISRVNPCKKSVRLGMFLSYMRMPYAKAHEIFLVENPSIQVSFSTFHKNRPAYMRHVSLTPLNNCACVFCTNINEKLNVLKLHNISNEQDLYKILICKKTGKLRNYNCISGKCKKCKDRKNTIEQYASPLDMTKEVRWKKWEIVPYLQKKTNKKVSKRVLVNKNGTLRKCLDEFIETDVLRPGKSKEFNFVKHFFTQSVQFQMYLECKLSLKSGQCLVIQDFAQNIEISHRTEIKASNWSKTQVTLHPQVFYYKTSESDEIKRQVIVHLSDITKHDPHIVHHMTQDCIDILSKMYPNEKWNKMYLWSDGCSSQYKGKNSFYYLDKFNVPVERHFFGSEHGKNECDGVTGIISSKYKRAVKSDDCVISNAHDLTNFFCKTFENDKSKMFKLVEKEDKDLESIIKASENIDVQVLSGTCTRTLHQIKASEKHGRLLTRPYSCFCIFCLNDDFNNCNNKGITGGNFTERILISKCKDTHISGSINDNHDESSEDNGMSDDDDDYEEAMI